MPVPPAKPSPAQPSPATPRPTCARAPSASSAFVTLHHWNLSLRAQQQAATKYPTSTQHHLQLSSLKQLYRAFTAASSSLHLPRALRCILGSASAVFVLSRAPPLPPRKSRPPSLFLVAVIAHQLQSLVAHLHEIAATPDSENRSSQNRNIIPLVPGDLLPNSVFVGLSLRACCTQSIQDAEYSTSDALLSATTTIIPGRYPTIHCSFDRPLPLTSLPPRLFEITRRPPLTVHTLALLILRGRSGPKVATAEHEPSSTLYLYSFG
ncbi:hypothetical protein G7046_g2784 [Stylonectria norvegica]|nr:hypothetical protein G7046_g2784 [Stylonectria norvegica]